MAGAVVLALVTAFTKDGDRLQAAALTWVPTVSGTTTVTASTLRIRRLDQ